MKMSHELAEEQLIRSYFLGDLPESEQERIHERLFTDPDFFESLLIVEGELVDDYVLGLISDQERAKLESGFLTSPYQYRKVEVVRTLDRYIANNKTVTPTVHNAAAAQIKVNDDENQRDLWERTLREAAANRNLMQSLIAKDWLGLELLLHLGTISQMTQSELASLVQRDDASLTAVLQHLIDSGLVCETAGKYSCSSFGTELQEKTKEAIGHD